MNNNAIKAPWLINNIYYLLSRPLCVSVLIIYIGVSSGPLFFSVIEQDTNELFVLSISCLLLHSIFYFTLYQVSWNSSSQNDFYFNSPCVTYWIFIGLGAVNFISMMIFGLNSKIKMHFIFPKSPPLPLPSLVLHPHSDSHLFIHSVFEKKNWRISPGQRTHINLLLWS